MIVTEPPHSLLASRLRSPLHPRAPGSPRLARVPKSDASAVGPRASELRPGKRLVASCEIRLEMGSATPASFRRRELRSFLALALEAACLEGTVSVLLTDDETIRRLNSRFRSIDSPTDVLSFPAASLPPASSAPGTLAKHKPRKLAGDLAISVVTAAQQAKAFGHPLEVELKILLLHGVLHLAGLDHEVDEGEMERRESTLRKKLGLPVGLIARADSARSAKGEVSRPVKSQAGQAARKSAPARRRVQP